MVHISVTVDHWLHDIDVEEGRDDGVHEANEVPREANIDNSVSFERAESLPPAEARGLRLEGHALATKSWDVLIDIPLLLGLDLTAFN